MGVSLVLSQRAKEKEGQVETSATQATYKRWGGIERVLVFDRNTDPATG